MLNKEELILTQVKNEVERLKRLRDKLSIELECVKVQLNDTENLLFSIQSILEE